MEKYCIKGAPQVNGLRDYQILRKSENGSTHKELALEYNVTRSRISAIIKKAKQDAEPGGRERRLQANLEQRKARRRVLKERRSIKTYGVGCEYIDQLRATHENYHKSALGRYMAFAKTCTARGVINALSIVDWWNLWTASGHYERYGDYGMGRIDYDVFLGYTKTNSIIRTNSENAAYYQNVRAGNIVPKVYTDSSV